VFDQFSPDLHEQLEPLGIWSEAEDHRSFNTHGGLRAPPELFGSFGHTSGASSSSSSYMLAITPAGQSSVRSVLRILAGGDAVKWMYLYPLRVIWGPVQAEPFVQCGIV